MRILIVDDSPLIRIIFKDYLKNEGFELYEAGTTQDAHKLSSSLRPELIIKDLFMPDSDALESIRFFIRDNYRVKVIICTTESSRQQILEALKAGARDFILKPLDKSQVIKVVGRVAFS